MTTQHRNRLLFAATIVIVVLGSGSFLATSSPMVALGVFALSAIIPAVIFGVVAYVWSANDREARARGLIPPTET